MRNVRIGGRDIGAGCLPLLVAEAGVNHEGRPDEARRLIELAAALGIPAMKFQTYKAEKLASPSAKKYWHLSSSDKPTQHQISTFKRLDGLPEHCYADLVKLGRDLGVLVFSTPFDEESVDILHAAETPALKIASGDITHHKLLIHAGQTGIPIVLAAGASRDCEITEALDAIRSTGNREIILLHCILDYPTDERNAHVMEISRLSRVFDVPIGFSDHTLGSRAPVLAARMGACMIEKHCTGMKYSESVSEAPVSPDHCFMSMEQIGGLATDLKQAMSPARPLELSDADRESILGDDISSRPLPCEEAAHVGARRSLFAMRDIRAGETMTSDHIVALRPGGGIDPTLRNWQAVVGMRAAVDIARDEPIVFSHLRS